MTAPENRLCTWMPFYFGDYLKDTMHLRTEGHGAYLLLIAHYWTHGKPLPDNDERLSAIVRLDRKDWKRLRPTLAEFFRIGNGVWRHKRIDAELDKAAKISQKRKEAGKIGGKASAESKANAQASATANAQANEVANEVAKVEAKPKQNSRQSQSQSQNQKDHIQEETLYGGTVYGRIRENPFKDVRGTAE